MQLYFLHDQYHLTELLLQSLQGLNRTQSEDFIVNPATLSAANYSEMQLQWRHKLITSL